MPITGRYDVLIIGGGSNGLQAYNKLNSVPNSLLKIAILEAKSEFPGEEEEKRQETASFHRFSRMLNLTGISDEGEIKAFIRRLNELMAKIDIKFPFKNRVLAKELESINLERFIDENCLRFASKVKRIFIRLFLGHDLDHINLLQVLISFKNNSTQCINDEERPTNVYFNQPVASVTEFNDGKSLLITTKTESNFLCQSLICAFPIRQICSRIDFNPKLDAAVYYAADRFVSGHAIRFRLEFLEAIPEDIPEEAATRVSGIPFTVYTEVAECGRKMSGFVKGREAIRLNEADETAMKEAILDALRLDSRLDLRKFRYETWLDDEFATKNDLPAKAEFLHKLRNPQCGKRVFLAARFAGANAGLRAALQVLEEFRPQILQSTDFRLLNEFIVSEQEERIALKNEEVQLKKVERYSYNFRTIGAFAAAFLSFLVICKYSVNRR